MKTINISEDTPTVQVEAIIKKSALSDDNKIALTSTLQQYIDIADVWKQKIGEIVITDESQIDLIEQAQGAAKYISKVRIELDKLRKEQGGQYYEQYKIINNAANCILDLIAPIEEEAKLKGNFIKLKREREEKELCNQRVLLIQPYSEFVPINAEWGKYSQVEFDQIFKTAKFAYDQQQIMLKQEEEERANQLLSSRKKALEELGMRYNEEFDSMSYYYNENMELDLSVNLVILKCNDSEYQQLLQQTATKILNINRRYEEVKAKEAQRDQELEAYKATVEAQKETIVQQATETKSALEQTKAVLTAIGVPINVSTETPDKIVSSDLDKIKILRYNISNISFPVLNDNIPFLDKLLENTISLVNKTIEYLDNNMSKIK